MKEKDPKVWRNFLHSVTEAERWPQVIGHMLRIKTPSQSICRGFHDFWTARGHRMREQIADDKLLLKALNRFLPPYEGGDMKLFRGENLTRWTAGRIGFSWTPKEKIGRMFGRGLNAAISGGVLLYAEVPAKAILAGPNEHSKGLEEDEFTINPHQVADIQAIEEYPVSMRA